MLPEIGATELMVIAAVALIVVGPKDLPALLRKLGSFVARLRGMASEFRTSFDDMARQSELDDLRKEVAAMRESAVVQNNEMTSAIDNVNKSIHDDITLAELREDTPAEPWDPNYQLYGEEDKPLSPADIAEPAPKKARAPRPKTTISKVEPPPVEVAEAAPAKKPAKPRAPRKAAT